MYIWEFHQVDADEAIKVEHFFRAACSGESIRYSPVDDTVSRARVQDKLQSMQVPNSPLNGDQKAVVKPKGYLYSGSRYTGF
jgi:hypothetical protein